MLMAQGLSAEPQSGCGMKGWAGRTRGHSHLKGCAGAWLCRLTPASILAAETHLPPDHRDARTVPDRAGNHASIMDVSLRSAVSGTLRRSACRLSQVYRCQSTIYALLFGYVNTSSAACILHQGLPTHLPSSPGMHALQILFWWIQI